MAEEEEWNSVTIGFVLQLLGESRLAHVVHELEQVLPAFAPEAGLHVTQEGDVLLARVRLREQILKRLTQGQQDELMIHGFVPTRHQINIIFRLIHRFLLMHSF